MLGAGIAPDELLLLQGRAADREEGGDRRLIRCHLRRVAAKGDRADDGRSLPICNHEAPLAVALALLVDSLIGPEAAALGFALALGLGAWPGRMRPGLSLAALAALIVNALLLTTGRAARGIEMGSPLGLVVYATEGVLLSALITGWFAARRRAEADWRAARRHQEAGRASPSRVRLLQESSHQSKERFRLLVEGVKGYAILLLDPEGRVASWNAGAERILGYRAGEVLGRHVAFLYGDDDVRRGEPEHDLRAVGEEGRSEVEAWRIRKDGARLWAHVGITALRDESGGLRGFAMVMRDLTERKRAEDALRRAHDELEIRVRERTADLAEANAALQAEVAERRRAEEGLQRAKEAAEAASRAKDQFLAVLSHELRNPLNPVLLAVSAMMDDPPEAAELRPTLAMIRRNVELEARLIDDLLDVARAASGRLALDLQMVDAHAVIHQALEVCRAELRTAGLALDLELTAAAHHVEADPARLQQIFWNLIRNATKFTPRGGSITIRTRNEGPPLAGPAGVRLIAEVVDTGPGIEPGLLPRIFDPFEQGEDAIRRRFGGMGLGLAIGRSVAEAHGGRLTAASAGRDRGATFTLELAALAAPDPTPPAPPTREAPPRGQALRILLVEDNKDSLQQLARLLGCRRHTVRTAADLASARELGLAEAFDVLISDIELPDGTGLDLMRELREARPVPGIAISGFSTEEDIQMSLAAGFAEHLAKPVDFQTLEAAVRRLAHSPEAAGAAP